MAKYKAVLIAFDGTWVTDYRNSDTIEEVQERLADQGSRWYFYPFHGVILDNGKGFTRKTQRLVDVAEPFSYMKGRSIRTFADKIERTPNGVLSWLS